jgi:hypothetical protein
VIPWRLAVALALTIGGSGCGYRLVGSAGGASILPEHIRAVVVIPFDNRTTRPEIEQRVTEEVARELSKRGRYAVVTDRAAADAMLEGAITTYRTSPVQFSAQGLATRVEAVVTLQATVRELATDAVLWSQQGLVFREQFDVPEGTEFFDQETLALDEIARGAAGVVVTSILEGF